MTGRVVHFGPPDDNREGVKILTAHQVDPGVQVKGGSEEEIPPVEVRLHEDVVVGDDKVRTEERKPGDPEVRVRVGDRKKWEQVRTLDDDPNLHP